MSGELHSDFIGIEIEFHSLAKELKYAENILAARDI
jgi:hypothetical protein